jgi:hypothetical protein
MTKKRKNLGKFLWKIKYKKENKAEKLKNLEEAGKEAS